MEFTRESATICILGSLVLILTIGMIALCASYYNILLTLDHQKMFFDDAEKSDRSNRLLLLKIGQHLQRDELATSMNEAFGKDYVKLTANTISAGQLILEFDQDKLKNVRNWNDRADSKKVEL